MATLYKRGAVWWGRFQYDSKEHRCTLETTSKSTASRRAAVWEKGIRGANWGEGQGHSYDDAMTSFIENHCPTLRPNSRTRYLQSAKFLTPFFTGMPLNTITSSKLAEFEARRRRDGVTPPTIRRDLACLSSMYTHAIVDLEWVETNPVLAFLKRQKRRGRLKESPPKTRYLSKDEERKLLAACLVDKNGLPIQDGQDLADQIAFAIDTGLRREEQWSLPWGRVELVFEKGAAVGGKVTVAKEIAKGKRERQVPLFPRSAQILARLPRQDAQGKEYPAVFVNADGKRFIHRNKGLREAAKRAGIPRLSWHDLRRTCGCRLLQEHGLSKDQIQEWLGHESVQQTERAYAFLAVDSLQRAVQSPAQRTGFKKKKPQ